MKKILHTLVLILAVQWASAQIPQACQASFGYSIDSTGTILHLWDMSYSLDSTPLSNVSYAWTVQFGGMSMTYNSPYPLVQTGGYSGPILVCLSISTSLGCQSSYCDTINFNPSSNCQANFSYLYNSQTSSVQFTDLSNIAPADNIVSWAWSFSGGSPSTSSLQNPVVYYNANGYYVVCLDITTLSGCSNSYCYPIHVFDSSLMNCQITVNSIVQNASSVGATDGSIDLSVSGGTPPYQFYWSNGANTEDLFNLGAGIYSVAIFQADSNCGNYSYTFVVSDSVPSNNCQFTVTSYVQDVSIIGGNDGFIDLTVSGGTPPYQFYWSNGANTEDLFNLSSGIYSVAIFQADSNCIYQSFTFQIVEPYINLPIDTLYAPPIDTCLPFIPDSFYVSTITVQPSVVIVTWVFQGQGMTASFTVNYGYQQYGTYVVTLTINCDTSKGMTTFMSYININQPYGIEENTVAEIPVYPNPFSDNITIGLHDSKHEIMIFSADGKLVYKGNHTGSDVISTQSWVKGVYFMKIIHPSGITTRKLIKQ